MIPKPQRDDEGKVQGEFYPLQKAELMALRKAKLINNAAFIHLALRYENPWCDRKIIVIPKEFGMRWQIPESSVYEAIAKLKEASAINIKSGRITIEWANSQQCEFDDSQQDDDSGNPENFWKSRNDSENPEKITESQKKFWKFRKNSGSSENRASKPSTGKDSTTLQTIQTYLDFINSLSESERENFIEFGKKKAAQLPKAPELPLKWIEKNFDELRSQWYKSRGKVSPAENHKWETDPRTPDWLAIIEETANPLEFATDKEKQDFIQWCNETKQFSWLKGES
ncbi:hypothetical protein [Nostoc sp. PA-18-2419]|uniref:hypothetical protein n=1 Tax=Nostoc sp. PA-18-2419 TaxID=2575443 RepID=UPI001677B0A9|nr:hypothetical protein [Nostoc sp. PA-18-2419]